MSLVFQRSNSCPGEIWCHEDKTNPGYCPPQRIPTWYEYWSALEFWYIKQLPIHRNSDNINKEYEEMLFHGMTDEAKVRTYKFLVGIC